MATSARTLSDLVAPQPRSRPAAIWRDALLALGGTALVALLAQVSLPAQPVPFTGQTLGVLLVGAALGWRRGGAALATYLALGVAGAPIFALHRAGIAVLLGPTGGYLAGFILAAMAVGFLAERGWDRSPLSTAAAMAIGTGIIYACGVPWLAAVLHLPLHLAYEFGMRPFLLWDAVKLAIAVIVLPGAWLVAGRRK